MIEVILSLVIWDWEEILLVKQWKLFQELEHHFTCHLRCYKGVVMISSVMYGVLDVLRMNFVHSEARLKTSIKRCLSMICFKKL